MSYGIDYSVEVCIIVLFGVPIVYCLNSAGYNNYNEACAQLLERLPVISIICL